MKKLYFLILFFLPFMAMASIPCPPAMTVYADGYDCTATVILPNAPWGGSCASPSNCTVTIPGQTVTHNGQHWVAHNLPAGNYTVYYTTTPSCYYSCSMNLHVIGGGNVTAICDQNTVVSLGQNGTGRVFAETFNDHSNSNCGNIVDIKVRRVYQGWCPPGVKDDTQFGPYVEFCCEDINSSPIKVILRVTDSQGNSNECSAYVHVQDRIPPVMHCLPDITVDCDYPINLNDLSEFGTIRKHQSHCGPIYVGGQHCGYDGYVVDNCDVYITESYTLDMNDCGVGTIRRKFTATDPSGNTTYCVQRIHIRDRYPFNRNNIHWPRDVSINECHPENVSPAVTGEPTYDHVACSMLAVTYTDYVFSYVGSNTDACMKILREWKVLDCCQYDRYGNRGVFTHTQTIKINDNEAPVFLDCSDIVINANDVNDCSGYVELRPQVEDCTPIEDISWTVWIDYDNNGTVDVIRHQRDVSGYFPFGTHKVTWQANDGCKNTSTCTRLVTIKDNVKPTPVCYASIATVVMENSGVVYVNAKVHDAGSWDNCTSSENLRFSFSSDASDNVRAFTCDDLGINEIPIYVTDESGNQSRCYVRLDIQDNNGVCLDSLTVHLAGSITTDSGDGVSDVALSVVHPQFGEYLINSDENGYFEHASYTDMSHVDSVLVMPLRVDDPLNGVTSFDLFLMHKINLGDIDFSGPYQEIAADINNDGRFSTIDLVELKNLILGQQSDFNNNLSWRFVNGMTPLDEDNPFDFSEAQYVSLPEFDSKFIGIKIGDMNLDAVASGSADSRSTSSVEFTVEDRLVTAGEIVEFSIMLSENNPLAYQLYLANNEDIEVKNIETGSASQNSFISENFASVIHYGEPGVEANEIKVRITSAVNAYLSDLIRISDVRPSLMISDDFTESTINLRFSNKFDLDEMVVDVAPNPIVNSARVYITSPQEQVAELQMYNVNGVKVLEKTITLEKGKNIIQLDADLNNLNAGVYYIGVKNDVTTVKKTILKM